MEEAHTSSFAADAVASQKLVADKAFAAEVLVVRRSVAAVVVVICSHPSAVHCQCSSSPFRLRVQPWDRVQKEYWGTCSIFVALLRIDWSYTHLPCALPASDHSTERLLPICCANPAEYRACSSSHHMFSQASAVMFRCFRRALVSVAPLGSSQVLDVAACRQESQRD